MSGLWNLLFILYIRQILNKQYEKSCQVFCDGIAYGNYNRC